MKIESEMDDMVELSFFHMEGMAAIFGIGIPFSVVRLTEMGDVEIIEVGEQIWRQSWADSSVQSGDMVIFEDQSSDPVTQPSPVPVDLTQQQAAEKFGIAAEGMSYFQPTNDSEKYPSTAHELIPPHEWMKSLFDLLRENHMVCAEGWKETNVEMTETDVEPTDAVGGPVGSGFGSIDTGGSSGQKPLRLDVLNMASGDSIENQPRLADSDNLKEEKLEVKQLTVVIRWRMDSLKFYCCCDRGNELQLRERDSRCAELFDPVSQNVLTGSPNLIDCEVVPVVKVEFLCGSDPMDGYEDGEKRFITTLSGSFHNKPHSTDQHTNRLHQFGWFHDNLSLSFKCKRPDAVEQELKDLDDKVLTAHERRTDGGAYGEEASGSLTSTTGGRASLSGGMPSMVTARANLNHTRRGVVDNKTTQSSSTQAWFNCLKESNFSIHRESSRSELCYVAKIFPPLAAYDMTRPRDWFTATRNGMMETIRIDIKGVWLGLDDDGDMFCPYEFLCQRYPFMRRSESSVKQTKDKNRSSFSRQQQGSSMLQMWDMLPRDLRC
ncbi:hypothetical protein R1flu_022692 [Riccia fluitans]|uniref:Uncharacterized protein n=1 Tax=Riccia fluitans TaxID=41844 RepID=A0ABD1XPX3_9MARC